MRSAQVIPTVTKSVEVPTKVARASAPVKGESELAGLSLIGLLIGAAVAATIVVVVASDSNG
ncbi:hypothetical protein A3711_02845 [Erythrobacter sp. HI00D59]|nr:hypothetical protein A3711_02845 [Erythrobacter sp. HI00D59]